MTPIVEVRRFPATLSLGKVNTSLTVGPQLGVDGRGAFRNRRRRSQVQPRKGGVGNVGVVGKTHTKLAGQLTVIVQGGPGLRSCDGCQCGSGCGGGASHSCDGCQCGSGCGGGASHSCIFFSAVVRVLVAGSEGFVLRLSWGVVLK